VARYQLQPVPADAAKQDLARVKAAFAAKASDEDRQFAIDFLVKSHGMNLANTKSLKYDPKFTRRDGENHNGVIRIGPKAFEQDGPQLAGVVFHEIVHSDQFKFYAQNGVDFSKLNKRDEPVRVLIALDEYEGFYWPWRNRGVLGLSEAQVAEFARELHLWQIEIDDAPTVAKAREARFNEARRPLMAKLAAAKKP
jgi:hypothetical protein